MNGLSQGVGKLRCFAFAATAVLTFPAVAGSSTPSPIVGPFTLTTLPSLGTVTWVCGPRDERGRDRYGLGFRVARNGATVQVAVRLGNLPPRRRTLDPGQRFPMRLSSAHLQEVTVVSRHKPGVLRARVSVDFAPSGTPENPRGPHCARYAPPGFTATVTPLADR